MDWKDFYFTTRIYQSISFEMREYDFELTKIFNDGSEKISLKGVNGLLENRHSSRKYQNISLELKEIRKLIFDSIYSNRFGFRAYPSAGQLYSIELFAIIQNVNELRNGIYYINQQDLVLEFVRNCNYEVDLYEITQNQNLVINSNVCICYFANFGRTINKYGIRGYNYIFLDCGHIAENFYIASLENKLSCVAVAGFLEHKLENLININDYYPIYMMFFGREEIENAT